MTRVLVLVLAVVCSAVADTTLAEAGPPRYRVVVHSALSGEPGDTIICFKVDSPRLCNVTFPVHDAHVQVTVTAVDYRGQEVSVTYENGGGTFPMLFSLIRQIKVEFRTAGKLDMLIHAEN